MAVSGDYDSETCPFQSRLLDPAFRFSDMLLGEAMDRSALALDALPGAPSFGAVEFYSLPSPGGAIRRTPRSHTAIPQRVFDVADLPKRSPRYLVDDRSLSIAVWKSTPGLGGPHQTSDLSSSIRSKSILLILGRLFPSGGGLEV